MTCPPRKLLAIIGVGVFALASLFIAIRKPPVLLHLFGDSDCACGDYQQELSGFALLNPLRDGAPERTAETFFAELREGRCTPSRTGDAGVNCAYALAGRRVSDWRLGFRRDKGDTVELYYKLTSLGAEPRYSLTGEGLVRAKNENGIWRVVYYDSYF